MYFLADALRYEMGRDLGMTLADTGTVRVEACASSLPTVTPFGMAALMPGADSTYKIVAKGNDLVLRGRSIRCPDRKNGWRA